MTPFAHVQQGMSHLKIAVYELLNTADSNGLKNVEIGRELGIYCGHEGHEGHISRTILAMLEHDDLVTQDKQSKAWHVVHH